jgi:NAD-dependent deacetylase
MLPDRALLQYEQALGEGFDLVMVVGTSAVFPYIAAPVQRAAMQRRATMEINPQRTDISEYCDVCLQTSAADALVALGGAMQAKV